MKKYYLLICLAVYAAHTFAQTEQKENPLKTYEKIELGINGFGVAIETPLSRTILSEFYIGLGPSYNMEDDGYNTSITQRMDWHWALLEPSFHASVYGKYYYNLDKRIKKGKSVRLNSGNFFGLKVKYVSQSLSSPQLDANTILVNLNWGIQRNIGKHWTFDLSTGLGFGHNLDNGYDMIYPALDLKIAYVLPFFDKK